MHVLCAHPFMYLFIEVDSHFTHVIVLSICRYMYNHPMQTETAHFASNSTVQWPHPPILNATTTATS